MWLVPLCYVVVRVELESNGGLYVITVLHNMSEKWSLFLKYVMEEGILLDMNPNL